MAISYRPKITEGAGEGFTPRCNQATNAGGTLNNAPTAAEMAAKAQARYAEQYAQQAVYSQAKEAARGKTKIGP